jgi:hypothetical protein
LAFVRVRAIDVGVIITRATELQSCFKSLGKGEIARLVHTDHQKLWPRSDGGGGCPSDVRHPRRSSTRISQFDLDLG